MKVIKNYTAIQMSVQTLNDTQLSSFKFGEIEGPYYSREYPDITFNTEQEALEYAFKTDKYITWLIIPIIRFDNY